MSTGQGYDDTDKTIAAVILTGAIILLPGGYFTYNLYQKLGNAQAEIETTKAQADELQRKLQEANGSLEKSQGEVESMKIQLGEANSKLDEANSKLNETQSDLVGVQGSLKDREQDMRTLTVCFAGIVEFFALLDSGDEAEAVYRLGSVESSCEESGSIIESLSSSKSSDLPLISS